MCDVEVMSSLFHGQRLPQQTGILSAKRFMVKEILRMGSLKGKKQNKTKQNTSF